MKKRLPLLVMGVLGVVLWKTGFFGFAPQERTLVWRFPVSYGEVRALELQVWDGEELVKRQETTHAAGLVGEPSFKLPLRNGAYRGTALVTLLHASQPTVFQRDFDTGNEDTVVIEMRRP